MTPTTVCLRAAALAALVLLAACARPQAQAPTRENFTAALDDYLARRGHLCLGKYDWPITVTAEDRRTRSLNAQQLPVLETLGLATGRDVGGDGGGAAREYTLTPAGRRYYLQMPVVVATATRRVTHAADFCVATLSRERLVGWEPPSKQGGRSVTSLLFTYKIDPAPWTQTEPARRAFPVVKRALENAGAMQLRLGVHLTPQGWVADELS